ncbi:hypothetical protein NQ317_003343 [Molorchus minor]|uniref:Peptidase S1 domain-containing protein n=1 Tax=Molorchus minor TaxID=1323400 RepID=A0ABQ9JFJ1_9CUCU|nr:hypothetical protein NQ317_003343 [Molorchus minor]
MKIAFLVLVFLSATWALPKGEVRNLYPPFKRLYVDTLQSAFKPVDSRIVNGHEVVPHSIPYQALLIISGEYGKYMCGGFLISPKFVLTAGHCINGANSSLVHLGAHDIVYKEDTQRIINGDKFILHEEFDEATSTNDIGIIELSEEVVPNHYISIAPLPSRGSYNRTYEDKVVRVQDSVVGGYTCGTGSDSEVLLEANATVIKNDLCKAFYQIVEDSNICTGGDEGITSCSGDSGGPLVVGNEVIGIVSFGVKDCVQGFPSGYTRIDSYFDWIEEHTGQLFF